MKLQICALLLSFLFARRKLRRRTDGDDEKPQDDATKASEADPDGDKAEDCKAEEVKEDTTVEEKGKFLIKVDRKSKHTHKRRHQAKKTKRH